MTDPNKKSPSQQPPDNDDYFPQTSKIIRENMEAKAEAECPDDDGINGAFFLDNDGSDDCD